MNGANGIGGGGWRAPLNLPEELSETRVTGRLSLRGNWLAGNGR